MCVHHFLASKKRPYKALLYGFVMTLAILSGLSDLLVLHQVGQVIADIFVKIFKLISLPLIALSIIVTLCQYTAESGMKRVGQRTLLYTLSTTVVAATVACLLYVLINPALIQAVPIEGGLGVSQPGQVSYWSYLRGFIPDHLFAPFMEHQVMSALLVSAVMGVAIRLIPDESARESMVHFFKGIHGVFMVITGWIVKLIPLALFGFMVTTIVQLKSGMSLKGLGGYLAVVVLANVIQGLIILPLLLKSKGVAPVAALRGMMPALSVAFFSKSSAGTLPVTLACAEGNLGVSSKVSRFVLPLCTTINMNGCAAFIFATVVYLMQNNGIHVSGWEMVAWVGIATIAAIGNAGVPMGCFFLSASLLTSMDVPITLLGLILPFYSLIDMIETSLNVWSDACVAKIVDVEVG